MSDHIKPVSRLTALIAAAALMFAFSACAKKEKASGDIVPEAPSSGGGIRTEHTAPSVINSPAPAPEQSAALPAGTENQQPASAQSGDTP